jgi:dolichyl-phosphate beta-glucosyltransferase
VHLSIVIPAYNEENRIGDTLRLAEAYLSKQGYDSEIIVVDDGSTDRTAALVQTLCPEVRVIAYERNRGKGYAVKTGMLAALGDYRVFMDADGSTPISDLDLLWPQFDAGADIVIGSRSLPHSRVLVRQHPLRENMGRMFNVLVKLFLMRDFIDTQCGFKGFTAKSAQTVFSRQRLDGFSFDAELLYIAQQHGLRIDEVPVLWCNSPQSRVRMFADSAWMIWDLLRIRVNAMAGRYR